MNKLRRDCHISAIKEYLINECKETVKYQLYNYYEQNNEQYFNKAISVLDFTLGLLHDANLLTDYGDLIDWFYDMTN